MNAPTEAQIRRWRSSGRYQRERMAYLKAHPFCRHCEDENRTVLAEELDHVIPVWKRPDLFWDRRNWQGLCTPHHYAKSDEEARERRGYKRKRIVTIEGDIIDA